jgi:hypothetical protein
MHMPDDMLEVIDVDETQALTKTEYEFICTMNRVCQKLALMPRDEAIQEVAADFGMDKTKARKLVLKAEEFLASGIFESTERSRDLYRARLTEIYSICMKHAVTTHVEQTTKPQRVEILVKDSETGQEVMSKDVRNVTTTKVKPNTLNTSALKTALAAAREEAEITGGRPRDRKASFSFTQINTGTGQANQPMSAQDVLGLNTDKLLERLGAERIIDEPEEQVLQVNGRQGEGLGWPEPGGGDGAQEDSQARKAETDDQATRQ